jgi:hypothetical protein
MPYHGYCIHTPRSNVRDRARCCPFGRTTGLSYRAPRRPHLPSGAEARAPPRLHSCHSPRRSGSAAPRRLNACTNPDPGAGCKRPQADQLGAVGSKQPRITWTPRARFLQERSSRALRSDERFATRRITRSELTARSQSRARPRRPGHLFGDAGSANKTCSWRFARLAPGATLTWFRTATRLGCSLSGRPLVAGRLCDRRRPEDARCVTSPPAGGAGGRRLLER